MPVDIVMPRLSDTMTEGTIARWLKKPGDPVKRGETLAEIETDKALMEYEAFEDGTLGEIQVGDGETAPLGATIATLYRAGEAAPAAAGGEGAAEKAGPEPDREQVPTERAPAVEAKPAATADQERPADVPPAAAPETPPDPAAAPSRDGGRVRASPLARRIAAEHGVDLAGVQGTGPGGRVVREDVEQVVASGRAEAPPEAPAVAPTAAPGDLVPFTRVQTVIARRMVESKTQIPHFYVTIPIDMDAAMRFRAESNAYLGKGNGLSLNDLFIKAAALALKKFPLLNAQFSEKGIQHNADVNVGNAVALEAALVVPVIRNADRKPLPEIAAESRALAQKARSGGLALADYEGGTFTVSNLGMLGVEEFSAIVNPPQVAILAVGAVSSEAVVVDGEIRAGQRCRVTLSCDHRVVYGWHAGEFLRELKGLLERPLSLVY